MRFQFQPSNCFHHFEVEASDALADADSPYALRKKEMLLE
jgi:hypothetical protein